MTPSALGINWQLVNNCNYQLLLGFFSGKGIEFCPKVLLSWVGFVGVAAVLLNPWVTIDSLGLTRFFGINYPWYRRAEGGDGCG